MGRQRSGPTGLAPAARALVAVALLHATGLGPSTELQGQSYAPTVSPGVSFESYRFSTEGAVGLRSVSLSTVPFSAAVNLRPDLRIRLQGAYASGRIERSDGTSATLRGAADTEVHVEAVLAADRLRVAGILALPSGHSRYTRDETEVAGIIAADVLPFQLRNWGTGGGAGLGTSVVHRVAEFGVGASASYLVAREFEVFADEDVTYRPGHQFTLGVAADRNVGRAGKAALQLQMVRYGDDELAGSNLFQSGSRYQALASYAFAAPRYSSAIAYGGVMRRSRGRFVPVADIVESQNLIMAGAVMRMPFARGVLVPSVDLRALRNADGRGQGYTTTVGTGAETVVAGITLLPAAKARFGRVVVFDGARSDFTGIELSLTTRFGGRVP